MARKKNYRWWVPVFVLLVNAATMFAIWQFLGSDRQTKVTATIAVHLISVLVLLFWFVFLSRFKRRLRFSGLGIFCAAVAMFFLMFEFRGFSGDLVPLFQLRWQETVELTPASVPQDSSRIATLQVQGLPGPVPSYPQFLGPDRTAKLTGVKLNTNWQANPPRLIWKKSIGQGWSGFAIQGQFAVTQEQLGEQEAVSCYQLETGSLLWRQTDATRHEDPLGGIGPRATPTIAGAHVYTVGGTGIMNCLDLKTGERIWRKNIIKENNAPLSQYGLSCSPLVLDTLVVVAPGGPNGHSLVAYDRKTGNLAWSGGDDKFGYSSPLPATLGGVPQILIFMEHNVVSHAPEDGRVLWKYPWPASTISISQPIILPGNRVLVSSGYGVGSKLLKVSGQSHDQLQAKLIWESNRLKSKFANMIYHDGFIYGLDDGIMVCLDSENGERRWKRGRYGHGQLLLVGEVLLVLSERGEIALVQATPDSFQELANLKAINGKTWNHPALAGDFLLVRNSSEAACFRLPIEVNLSGSN